MDPSAGYPLENTIDRLTPPKVVAANSVNLIISLVLLGIAVSHWTRSRTRFNLALYGPVLALLVGDAAYFLAISGIISANANEPFRTIVPVVTTWLACGLACIRFQVFAEAGLAKWYSLRLSRMLILTIYLHGVITLCLLTTSYLQQIHLPAFQTHPLRKIPLLIQFGVNAATDLVLAVFTFKIVWGMRQAVLKRKGISVENLGSRLSPSAQVAQMMTMTVPAVAITCMADHTQSWQHTSSSGGGGGTTAKESKPVATTGVGITPSPTHTSGELSAKASASLDHHSLGRNLGGGLQASRSIPSMRSIASNALAPLTRRSRGHSSAAASSTTATLSGQHPHIAFLTKSARMLLLIAFMITVSISGIVVYIFSKEMFTDALSLMALKIYLGATMLQWGLVLGAVFPSTLSLSIA